MNQLNDYNCHIHIAPVHLGACVSAPGGGGGAAGPKFYAVVYPVPNIIFLIYIPCSKLEGLKTIPWPAAHTRIVNVWEYPSPGFPFP